MSHHMLVVDDHEPIRRGIAAYFRAMGHQVDVAKNADEAEEWLAGGRYSVVIVDLRLGPSSEAVGLGVLEKARTLNPSSYIMVLTAYGSPSMEAEARVMGANAFLHKPQDLADIEGLVNSFLHEG
jgi:DNA-binding NtrC family response regulator